MPATTGDVSGRRVSSNPEKGEGLASSGDQPLSFPLSPLSFLSARVAPMEARGTAPRSMPSICQCDYVRSSPVEVSRRWSVSNPRLDEFSKVSLAAGERAGELAQISDTAVTAPGGLSQRQGTQPKLRSQSQVVVGFCVFPECFTRVSSTWARRTDVTTHVEPSSPPITRRKLAPCRHGSTPASPNFCST